MLQQRAVIMIGTVIAILVGLLLSLPTPTGEVLGEDAIVIDNTEAAPTTEDP